ncbi:MAG TPA: rhodanese-like domain-containing protein [Burkholderiales bacterium]|nr:rhodanese-like domain-containing protein [Burkholderiales bacterium]
MSTISEILALAQARASPKKLPYEGELLPVEGYELWQKAPGAKLVDVRTHAERDYVGRIPGAVEIEWESYPDGKPNPYFVEQLRQQIDRESLVMFICRSGNRSHHAAAAAAAAGYTQSYNVLEGFEGKKDAKGHRNSVGGWRVAGLPWSQS